LIVGNQLANLADFAENFPSHDCEANELIKAGCDALPALIDDTVGDNPDSGILLAFSIPFPIEHAVK
jgi:hypothetical protein